MNLKVLAAFVILASLLPAQAQGKVVVTSSGVTQDMVGPDSVVVVSGTEMNPQAIKEAIANAFCDGVGEGSRCKVPKPLDGELYGVCCGGTCKFMVGDCSRMPPTYNLYDALQRLTCRNAGEGYRCNIPAEISRAVGGTIWGTCCRHMCRIGIQSCGSYCGDGICTDEERSEGNCIEDCGQGNMQPPDRGGPPTDEELNTLGKIGCLGAEEGAKCILPKEMETELGLSGVCCEGRCNYRKTVCANKSADINKPDLIVSSIEINPQFPTEDDKVNVTVTVENVGNAPVNRSFWIRLRAEVDGRDLTDVDYEVKQVLNRGESISHTFANQLGLGRTGTFSIKADVDHGSGNFPGKNNLIDELNDTGENNFAATGIYVRPQADFIRTVCGNGLCEKGEGENCPQDCLRGETQGGQPWYLVAVAAAAAVAVILILRSRKRVTKAEPIEDENIEQLEKEKAELENMLAIAKSKYHKRELDEESFREIVRDNQKRIIEIELKIRVNRP